MPDIVASLVFLADLDLYKTTKPYHVLLQPQAGDPDNNPKLQNLEWEIRDNIKITDIRDQGDEYTLERSGFEVGHHMSKCLNFETPNSIEAYKRETEDFHRKKFGAVYVLCYEARIRKNQLFNRRTIDLSDPLLVEGPARGAHNDVTRDSGPRMIVDRLPKEAKECYLSQPRYRYRIINTWRSLIPVLEDNPLAVCDARSIDPEDLIATDRVIPTRHGEVYYLRFNKGQKWCWLENMKAEEPLIMLMYDTQNKSEGAKYCPHVPFTNPRASDNAATRHSIETRSIVITENF